MPNSFHNPLCFASDFYLAHNDDVAASGFNDAAQSAIHYGYYGKQEGRAPNIFFDPYFYLAKNADVAAACGATNYAGAMDHWLRDGFLEGRRGSALFDVRFYLSAHGDLTNAFGPTNYPAAFDHWMRYGVTEGRRSVPDANFPLMIPGEQLLLSDEGATLVRALFPAARVGNATEPWRKPAGLTRITEWITLGEAVKEAAEWAYERYQARKEKAEKEAAERHEHFWREFREMERTTREFEAMEKHSLTA